MGTRARVVGCATLLAVGLCAPVSAAPPVKAAPPAYVAPPPLTPEELEVLDEVEEIGKRYESALNEHRRRIVVILKREYKERIKALEARYAKSNQAAREQYKRLHLLAMAELEKFLAKYPNDPKWSPDVMFRLAELYLDQSGLDYEEKEAQLLAAGANAEPAEDEDFDADAEPAYDGPNFTRATEMWKAIVAKFPKYRQIDAALYLMGYYLGEMGMLEEAKQAYLGLVCANRFNPLDPPAARGDPDRARIGGPVRLASDPYANCVARKKDSNLLSESWVRIGEAHFDTRGELPHAIAAYKRVVVDKESEYYDEALYKLAWSYYRNDQFIEGIDAFDELVVFSDKEELEGRGSVELRKESIDYLAISFADPWKLDAQPDPAESLRKALAYYKGRLTEPHVRDVFEQLGDTLRIGEAYEQSVGAWRVALENWPLHPRNPIVHQKIVDAWADKGDSAMAMDEQKSLAEAYRKGSEWYVANETNREAMENAIRLSERSLLAAAKSTHRKGQLAYEEYQANKTPQQKEVYLALYAKAAELYQDYLSTYPTSPEVYALTYRMADTYFFSEKYIESVPHYRWVRDHKDLSTKYFEPSALSIVQAYQAGVDKAVKDGTLSEPPLPTAEALGQSSTPLVLPDLYKQLQAAYDEYMNIVNDQKTAPKMALASAMVSYRHLQLDDALERFSVVMRKYCQAPEAAEAKDGILVIHQSRNDDARFQATIDNFVSGKCGSDDDVQLAKAQRLSKDYDIAARLFRDGQFAEAALKFYYLYRVAPKDDENRDDALFSAAVAFEKSGKPKTAIAIYQEFSKQKKFRKSEYYVEALYRTAVSYQNAFDYDNAVDTFMTVSKLAAERGRTSRAEFNMDDARLDSMWNAAILREQDRVYYDRGKNDPGAATLFKRYAETEKKNKERAMQAYFRAALVYEKAQNTKAMMRAFKEFRDSYGKRDGAPPLVVLSYYKTAKVLEKSGDKKGAKSFYEETVKAFDRVGEAPGSDSSELAGEAQFILADQVYRAKFETYKVKWKGDIASRNKKKAEAAVQKTLGALATIGKETATGFIEVIRFQSTWTVAALVRRGDISFFAGDKLIQAPVPKEIIKLDNKFPDLGVLDQYQSTIEQQVEPQTLAAKEDWLKVVETAKQKGIANKWTKLANERLNTYIAADLYPVMRDELTDPEVSP